MYSRVYRSFSPDSRASDHLAANVCVYACMHACIQVTGFALLVLYVSVRIYQGVCVQC